MKTRSSFVSNSSSSSFVVAGHYLSDWLRFQIENIAGKGNPPWTVYVLDDGGLACFTDMNNMDLEGEILALGVPREAIINKRCS